MKNIYNSFNKDPFHTHQKLLKRVKKNSAVMELGCATGYFTGELLKKGCSVVAIEKDKKAVREATKSHKARFINGDLSQIEKFLKGVGKFDYILCADVLEHLENPQGLLKKLKRYLSPQGKLLISVPNVANFAVRFNLLVGNFNYRDFGIMDRTHLRFFTKKTIEKMLKESGFIISDFDLVPGFETSKLYSKTLGRITFRVLPLRYLEYLLTRILPGLFALEFIYEAS